MKHIRPSFHIVHKITALLLSAALLPHAAFAAVLGNDLTRDGIELSDTARLVEASAYNEEVSGKRQSERYIEYSPDSGLRPIVAYGNTLYGRSDINYVNDYLNRNGLTATAGINGSFFSMSNGVPIGCVITEGIVRSSGNGNSIGFRADGSAVIGVPGLDVRVSLGGSPIPVNYNKTLTKSGGFSLYSRDYDEKTRNTAPSRNVLLSAERGTLRLGDTVRARVESVDEENASCTIPEGGYVLSLNKDSDYQSASDALDALSPGDEVLISCSVSSEWADVQYACGGDEMLVMNGEAKREFSLDSAGDRASRTAAGLKADGTLVLYTIDGRQSGYSAGLTLAELAGRMAELGCHTALNLDGGGSTSFAARKPGETGLSVLNKPSDGELRKCANFLFLVRESAAPGRAVRLHLYPYDAALLPGARFSLTAKATDANWQAVALPPGLTYSAEGGAISEDGVFTAGEAGTATVRAAADGASGTRAIRIVDGPDSISIQRDGKAVTSLKCAPGQSVDLNAAATRGGYRLTAQDDCFEWSVKGAAGEIGEDGVFVAASDTSASEGSVVCSYGNVTAEVKVSVEPLPPEGGTLYGFEPGEPEAAAETGLELSSTQNAAHVRYGRASLRVKYDLSHAGTAAGKRQARARLDLRLGERTDTLGLWVYGDGSNNSLSLLLEGGEGFKWLGQLNFTGWKYLTAPLPEGTTAVTGFAVTEYDGAPASGTIWLDQLIASSGVLEDTEAPSISALIRDGALEVTTADTGSGVGKVLVTLDGEPRETLYLDGADQLLLPTDGKAHQVRVEASDRCGNLAAKTVELPGTLEEAFSDMAGHWAEEYAGYCARQGILRGSSDGKGGTVYRPDAPMSRQEFAVALLRFLGVDAEDYAAAELPYADADEIEAWALNAMKAARSLGLLTGSSVQGTLYGQPKAAISRQEAVTILGRTQARGYPEADLSKFSDEAEIASWAAPHAASLTGQGILSGSHGKLSPSAPLTRAQVAKILYFLY